MAVGVSKLRIEFPEDPRRNVYASEKVEKKSSGKKIPDTLPYNKSGSMR
jgi:hypothetical protein